MIFGRNRNAQADFVELPEHLREEEPEPEDGARPHGPRDITEVDNIDGLVDLGPIKLAARPGVNIQLNVDEKKKHIFGLTLTDDKSTLQIQLFSAPSSGGQWAEVQEGTIASAKKSKGTVEKQDGPFGEELIVRIPAKLPDGRPAQRVARFIGIDGPRWMCRAVLGGEAVMNDKAGEQLLEILSESVIDRGDQPMPPRQMMTLKAPENMRPARAQEQDDLAKSSPAGMPERGPEITEFR